MKQNSNNSEAENLLSLIFQGGQIKIEDGQLWVGPPEVARKFGDQIKRLKPEILIALGHCPICARELTVKVEPLPLIERRGKAQIGRHAYCSGSTPQHYDKWDF